MKESSIIVYIQRDAHNNPFATVLYNEENAYYLKDRTKEFAVQVSTKTNINDDKLIKPIIISAEEEKEICYKTINLEKDKYIITGCNPGEKNILDLITILNSSASKFAVQTPLIVTDGEMEPIFYNEERIDRYLRLRYTNEEIDNLEQEKYAYIKTNLKKNAKTLRRKF